MKNPLTEHAWQIIYALFCIGLAALVLAMAWNETCYLLNRGF